MRRVHRVRGPRGQARVVKEDDMIEEVAYIGVRSELLVDTCREDDLLHGSSKVG